MRQHCAFVFAAALLAIPVSAQTGPDVIVGELTGPSNYGQVGGTYAYALGTTSCNKGTSVLSWVASTNQHPVIGQNLYRLKNNRFEQVGQSWLKHGFTALQGTACFPDCQANPNGSALGVHCSDPYSSGLNGQQSGLGPKWEVNAATGFYPYPYTSPAYSGAIARRLQVATADLDPAQNPGALYFGEGHYIAPDDAAAGNDNNNASYRQMLVAAGTFSLSYSGSTQREKPGIQAWKDQDSSVTLTNIQIPGDGLMILGHKAVALGGGLTRHEYALYNMNSDRSARAIHFAMPAGAVVSALYFHDVPYHSGEPFNGIDWSSSVTGSEVLFSCTETFTQNPNANALRWGSLYNFSFTSDMSPGGIQIDLFKPGTPASVSIGPVFTMDLSTNGGGAGNFHLGIDNVPATTTEGFCVFSLNTSLTFGTGALLGITPDIVSLICLTSPLEPGSFLHWSYPVAGIFPAIDFDLPNGSLPFPAGTQADGVAFALSGGAYLGATAPVRITF